jgi:hypothetical protein
VKKVVYICPTIGKKYPILVNMLNLGKSCKQNASSGYQMYLKAPKKQAFLQGG